MSIRLRPDTDVHPQRVIYYAVMGFFAFMHINNAEVGPEPLSPFLLQLIMDGRHDFCIDTEFTSYLSPSVYRDLLPWIQRDPEMPLQTQGALASLLMQHEIDVGAPSFCTLC